MVKTLATVVLTAVLTSAFWIFAFGISRSPQAESARVNGRVEGKGDEATVKVGQANAPVSVAEGVEVGPAGLAIPVAGIKPAQLQDTFTAARAGGARRHDAIDILAAEGTPVVAAAPGTVEKLFESVGKGGTTAYVRSDDGKWTYYYAHLQAYAPGLHEGQRVAVGTPIGLVGHSGDASPDGPHLHFAINQMNPGERWYQGSPINPYPLLAGKAANR
ncbi:MAG: M23 family metallopeptidase [Pseudomonadota bacterium]|nr:M23 family metallopeptidase [Pseudomonadota bacterium]